MKKKNILYNFISPIYLVITARKGTNKTMNFENTHVSLEEDNNNKVTVNLTAPLYFWHELGHIGQLKKTLIDFSTPITMENFEKERISWELPVFNTKPYRHDDHITDCWNDILRVCETLRKRYIESGDEKYKKELYRILPFGWLETRVIEINYIELKNIYSQNKNNDSIEWKRFNNWIRSLPYADQYITSTLDK